MLPSAVRTRRGSRCRECNEPGPHNEFLVETADTAHTTVKCQNYGSSV